jgi:hypothetical protein
MMPRVSDFVCTDRSEITCENCRAECCSLSTCHVLEADWVAFIEHGPMKRNIIIAGLLLAASAAQAQNYIPARPFVGMPGRDFPMPPQNYPPPKQLYTPPARAGTSAPQCGVDPIIYPALKAAIERTAQSALKEVPNGSTEALWKAFSDHLRLELPDPRKLNESTRIAYERAFTSFGGLSHQQLANCFPALAPFEKRYEEGAAKAEGRGAGPRTLMQPGNAQGAVSCGGPLAQLANQAPPSEIQRIADQVAEGDPTSFGFWTFIRGGIGPAFFLEDLAILDDVVIAEFLFVIRNTYALRMLPFSQTRAEFNAGIQQLTMDFMKGMKLKTQMLGVPLGPPPDDAAVERSKQIRAQVQACFPAAVQTLQKAADMRVKEAEAYRARQQQHQMEITRQEEETRRREQERQELQIAEARKPINVLKRAYGDYKFLKHCYDAREGYLAINISRQELDRARQAVKRIEEKLKPQLGSDVDINKLWGESNDMGQPNIIDRGFCQFRYSSLMQVYNQLAPEDRRIEKDF